MRHTLLLALTAAAALSACDASEHEEITKWMAEQRAATKPQVQPIPEPKKFTPEVYAMEGQVEPFSNQKLTLALKRDAQQAGCAMHLYVPDLVPGEQIDAGEDWVSYRLRDGAEWRDGMAAA